MKKRWKIVGLVVLIVVVAVGITSLFIYKSVQHLGDEFMKQIEPALKLSVIVGLYNAVKETELTDINQLVPEYLSEIPKDIYGTPYKLRREGEKYIILGAGPDKEFDNKDDTKISFGPTSKIGKERPLKVKIGDKIQKATGAMKFRAIKRKGYEIKVIFKSVAGLEEMAPVRLSGVGVGRVEKINLIQEPTVRVEVILWVKEGTIVRENSRFNIATIGLLGEKYIIIIPGSADSPVAKPGTTFIGCEPIILSEEEQKELIRKLFLTLKTKEMKKTLEE